jgi:hypothetical protein
MNDLLALAFVAFHRSNEWVDCQCLDLTHPVTMSYDMPCLAKITRRLAQARCS